MLKQNLATFLENLCQKSCWGIGVGKNHWWKTLFGKLLLEDRFGKTDCVVGRTRLKNASLFYFIIFCGRFHLSPFFHSQGLVLAALVFAAQASHLHSSCGAKQGEPEKRVELHGRICNRPRCSAWQSGQTLPTLTQPG